MTDTASPWVTMGKLEGPYAGGRRSRFPKPPIIRFHTRTPFSNMKRTTPRIGAELIVNPHGSYSDAQLSQHASSGRAWRGLSLVRCCNECNWCGTGGELSSKGARGTSSGGWTLCRAVRGVKGYDRRGKRRLHHSILTSVVARIDSHNMVLIRMSASTDLQTLKCNYSRQITD